MWGAVRAADSIFYLAVDGERATFVDAVFYSDGRHDTLWLGLALAVWLAQGPRYVGALVREYRLLVGIVFVDIVAAVQMAQARGG